GRGAPHGPRRGAPRPRQPQGGSGGGGRGGRHARVGGPCREGLGAGVAFGSRRADRLRKAHRRRGAPLRGRGSARRARARARASRERGAVLTPEWGGTTLATST